MSSIGPTGGGRWGAPGDMPAVFVTDIVGKIGGSGYSGESANGFKAGSAEDMGGGGWASTQLGSRAVKRGSVKRGAVYHAAPLQSQPVTVSAEDEGGGNLSVESGLLWPRHSGGAAQKADSDEALPVPLAAAPGGRKSPFQGNA